MNIQDKMQEIHHKFGVTEKANYEIQLFVDDLIKKDRAEQLILSGVSQRSELLFALLEWIDYGDNENKEYIVESFLKDINSK